ncbi:MAG: Holliday junction ATP-dependent DNA helicase RuvA [Parcubacteria group bacterium GW2011_GWC2_45_7]|nr:MAG: Holliday junction ATP-dependent DNA helicase RuvA [Parcubacteria group bacterium GW2011_GWC2_45_7]KKU73643.1 MAG: Holliday junction ATP-dependent DNA helicase RuvA [Parcubacteria group bacterium GW2011_GWA2_47_26]
MISYLHGQVKLKNKDNLVVVIDNIGYEVFVPAPALEKINLEEEQEFFTHEYLRENARELYGFLSHNELLLFRELIKVSGVGPRMALNVLSLGADRVREAISKGDAGLLASISGVGKKTSQKIVLELKGILSESLDINSQSTEEAIDVLKRLGYSQREASAALQHLSAAETTEEKIKAALKILGKR